MSPTDQPNPTVAKPDGWFRRHRAVVLGWGGIALFLLLLLAFGQLQRHLTQQKIDTKLAAIRAQGLPVTLSELNDFYAPVPDVDNAALLLNQVSRQIINWPYYDPLIGISPTSVLYATNPITLAAQVALNDLIRSNQTALKLIYDATNRTQFRYPLELAKNSHVPSEHWGEMKKLVQLLRLESIHHLASGRKADALQSVEASLFVTRSLDGEPLLASYLVQYACLDISLTGLEQLLQRTKFPAEDLHRLQEKLLAQENRLDLSRILCGARACAVGTWYAAYMNSSHATRSPTPYIPNFLGTYAWRIYEQGGHKEVDLLNFLNLYAEIVAVAKLSPAAALESGRQLENRLNATLTPSMNMIRTTWEARPLLRIFPKQAGMLATLRTTQTALAVERFRLENNRLPSTLGELIPNYLAKAPMDPFNERPLLYRITEKGFRIYSTGENGQDDGGLTRAEKQYPGNDDMVFAMERPK